MNGRLLVALATIIVAAFAPGAALASPPQDIVMLSSWTPDAHGGSIIGGDQSVTVINVGVDTTDGFSYSLDPAPCACSRTEVTLGAGWLSADGWEIPALEPGESASITVRYAQPTSSSLAPSEGWDTEGWPSTPARRTGNHFAHVSLVAI